VIAQDLEAFARLMAALAEIHNETPTPQRLEIYFRVLADWSIEVVAAAVDAAIRRLKFFPKPAELIELIEGSPDDRAEHAWGQFWLAVARGGTYQSLYCADVVLAETIRRVYGSWADAGHVPRVEYDAPGHQIHHKNFVAMYRDLCRHPEPWAPHLVGIFEATNTATMPTWTHGLPAEPLVTYLPAHGDPEPRPLRALAPQHPLVALVDRLQQPALAAGDTDDVRSSEDQARPHPVA
jgi:hypothetical protein